MGVQDIINEQHDFAVEAVASAQEFLDSLATLASADSIIIEGLPAVNYVDNSNSTDAVFTLLGFRPPPADFNPITAELPTFVESLFSTLPDVIVPDFTKDAPILTIPQTPDSTLPIAPTAPSISDPVIPTAPEIVFPDAPVITGLDLPIPPSIEIPVFDTTLPDNSDILVPSNTFTFQEEAYQSAILDELQSKLLSDLENGTYGIEPLDEQGLWDRAREREVESASGDMDELYIQTAARGFPLPPGDLNVALQHARQLLANKVSSISRDIALKRGDLFVEARQFTIEQAKGLEQILIGFHNSVMERALNAAKATLEAAIAIFGAQVARYNAQLDAYKSEAQVFEARVRAQLATVEVYRTTMEGKRIESEIQRDQVALYSAQLDAVNTIVSVYKTRLEAASVQASVERIRLDSFRALIDAYTSQVSAKVAEFNMYDAQIRGETTKMQAYQAEVQAYTSKVAGAKAKSDILIARLESEISQGEQRVREFQARVDGYRADLQGQTAQVQATLARYSGDVDLFRASATAAAAGLELTQESRALDYNTNLKTSEIAIENAKTEFAGIKAALDLKLDASGAGAATTGALAAGAVNAINALTTLQAEGVA